MTSSQPTTQPSAIPPAQPSALGFPIILAAQFCSAMADNALLFAVIELLKVQQAPDWATPVAQQCFVAAFIVLAPFVGPFADSLPKGQVMFISNSMKLAGCLGMVVGLHPLAAYALVGVGAAMYSPAKYGILSEYYPPQRLVWANGWMEGLTVAAIISGTILGGALIAPSWMTQIWPSVWQWAAEAGIDTAPEIALLVVTLIYLLAAAINLAVPMLKPDHPPRESGLRVWVADFWVCFWRLWSDPLGQLSLSVTTLFWAVGATLRLVVLVWGTEMLGLAMDRATQLTAFVAIGVAVGSALAGKFVPLASAPKVLRIGVGMGIAIMLLAAVGDWRIGMPALTVVGAMGGFFLVPMNSILQHRGHELMGAGRSIAQQNFNENLGMLLMLGIYALMVKINLSIQTIMVSLGAFVCLLLVLLMRRHASRAAA